MLISPQFHDSRIWGRFAMVLGDEFNLTTVDWPGHGPGAAAVVGPVDKVVQARRMAGEVGALDAVLAVDTDTVAVIEILSAGLARSGIVIDAFADEPLPEVSRVEVPPMDESEIQAILAAAAANDPAVLAEATVEHNRRWLPADEQSIVRKVMATNGHLILDGVQNLFEERRPWLDKLAALNNPILFIATKHESVAESEALAARCARGQLRELRTQSDYPWLERPEELAAVVSAFVVS